MQAVLPYIYIMNTYDYILKNILISYCILALHYFVSMYDILS